jgi:dihydrofolate reductase
MSKLVLKMSKTLDGFVCGPKGEMDWFFKTRSDDGAAWTAEKSGQARAHLIGRKTFVDMAAFWPSATGVFASPMNEIPKIVFSKKGFDVSQALPSELPPSTKTWAEAKVISGDLVAGLTELKKQDGKPLIAHGGGSFAQDLVRTGLIDEFWLLRHPVAIGQGVGLFAGIKMPLSLKLVETRTFSSGTVANIFIV